MSTTRKAAPKAEDKKDGATNTDETSKDDAATDDSTDESTEDTKPAKAPKQAKTYTKAELEAEKQRAIAAEKAKWEEEKDLSELDRIKKENQELRDANRLRDAKDEVVAALTAAGNKSPEFTFNAMKGDLKFDDSGKLINSKDLIDGLKTNYPEQFGVEKPTEGIDAGAGGGQAATKLTREAIEKMSHEEVNKNWDEVSKVLAEGK